MRARPEIIVSNWVESESMRIQFNEIFSEIYMIGPLLHYLHS